MAYLLLFPASFNNGVIIGETLSISLEQEFNNKKEAAQKLEKKAKQEFEQAKKVLVAAQKRIALIQEQIGILASKKTLKEQTDIAKKQNKNKVKNNNKKININKVSLKKNLKNVIKVAGPVAAMYTLSFIINKQINILSQTVQELNTLVTRTNDIIREAYTVEDIQIAKIHRNAALVSLDSAERQVKRLANTIKTINKALSVLTLMVGILSTIPTSPYQVAPLAIKVTRLLAKITPVITSLAVLSQISTNILNGFLANIQYERNRLLPLNKILNISDNPIELNDMLDNEIDNNGLGPVDGIEYKGFTFII